MGMYTELILGCELKKDTPEDIIKTLESMVYGDESGVPEKFRNKIYRSLLIHSSYSFGVCKSNGVIWKDEITEAYHISTRSSIKNYHNEIEIFLEWLKPYIESGSGSSDMYAIVTYEESEFPKIYYLHNQNKEA